MACHCLTRSWADRGRVWGIDSGGIEEPCIFVGAAVRPNALTTVSTCYRTGTDPQQSDAEHDGQSPTPLFLVSSLAQLVPRPLTQQVRVVTAQRRRSPGGAQHVRQAAPRTAAAAGRRPAPAPGYGLEGVAARQRRVRVVVVRRVCARRKNKQACTC